MKLWYFNMSGKYAKFQEFEELTVDQVMEAIKESAETGQFIEIYYSKVQDMSQYSGTPDVGFVFAAGMYRGHGLGSVGPRDPDNHIPWLWELHESANQYKGRDGLEMREFFQNLPR